MYEKDSDEECVLESVHVDMDPVLDGFEGAMVELAFKGGRYVLTETALVSGNLIFRFASTNYQLAYGILCQHTAAGRYDPIFSPC